MRVPLVLAPAALCLLVSTGCMSLSTQTRARTLEAGKTEVTASLGGVYHADIAPPVLPDVQVHVRHGVSDRVELGASLGSSGLSAAVKVGLVRSETPRSGLNLSLHPKVTAAFWPGNEGGLLSAQGSLPLLVGIPLGEHELTFAPGLRYVTETLQRFEPSNLLAGATVGIAFRVTKSFTLTPEVGLYTPLDRNSTLTIHTPGRVLPTFALGFTWGNDG